VVSAHFPSLNPLYPPEIKRTQAGRAPVERWLPFPLTHLELGGISTRVFVDGLVSVVVRPFTTTDP